MKRIVLFFVSLLIVVATQAFDFTVNQIKYTTNGDKEVFVQSRQETYLSGDIVIPSTVNYAGHTYSVTAIREYAFIQCSYVTSITIPEGITYIGKYAFRDCSSLTSFFIPEGVTSIDEGAFYYCTNLTSVHIPSSLTSLSPQIFECCFSLSSVVFPEGLTEIGLAAFYNC
ncbi:MAG: leucine-rich repeat domain-containing protein [Bacteroidales bacterium]|nr:leucine-rich repeat domain-containing protein [Bacteroidales bacterium]